MDKQAQDQQPNSLQPDNAGGCSNITPERQEAKPTAEESRSHKVREFLERFRWARIKNFFDVKSFRMKVLILILAFVAFFIGILWLLQITFFENYYEYAKEQSVKNTASHVEQLLKKYRVNELEDMLEEIAFDGSMCIELRDLKGKSLYTADMAGRDCVIHSNKSLLVSQLVNMYNQEPDKELRRVLTSYRFDSQSYLLIREVEDFYGGHYLLWVSSPLLPVKSTTEILQQQLMLVTLILLISGILISLGISRYITKPVGKISAATKAVAKGDYEVRVEASGRDEISEMANNFNYMVDELSKVDSTRHMLLANISHDLRTPLTMIKGYAETIKDLTGDIPEKRNQQLDIIVREADRLSLLVNDVLNYTTMNQAGFELTKEPFDLNHTVADIVERYRVIAPEYEISYETTGPCTVYADIKRIEQVVYNLLNNAINHIGDDQKILVKLKQGKFRCRVSVIDHGVGIAKEHLPFIWDRYYKVNKSGKRTTKGTGLGLSIIKTILNAHYAPFGVDSVEGQGSVFWFEVPLWYYEKQNSNRPPDDLGPEFSVHL